MTMRLFIVTFDLPGARHGDPRYDRADRTLRTMGRTFAPLKQTRLLASRLRARDVRNVILPVVGPHANIFVARITASWAFRVLDPGARGMLRTWLKRLA